MENGKFSWGISRESNLELSDLIRGFDFGLHNFFI